MKEARAIVLRTGIKMTRELLAYPNELMMISRTGAGVDNVDIPAATEQGIIVTSSIGVNTTSVAEHALALDPGAFQATVPHGLARCGRGISRSGTRTCRRTCARRRSGSWGSGG